ncbi:hypothetical protein TWF132_007508 [Orbilia oligospora]|nr:hypothetical protein TWF132_007508 [Orbilia oligospora]
MSRIASQLAIVGPMVFPFSITTTADFEVGAIVDTTSTRNNHHSHKTKTKIPPDASFVSGSSGG